MEASSRLDDLVHIGARLHGVLEQENAALRAWSSPIELVHR